MSTPAPDPAEGQSSDERTQDRSDTQVDVWFDRQYPRMVGLVRSVLDPDGGDDGSWAAAEDLCVEAFSRSTRRGSDDERTTSVLRRCLDGCMDVMVGSELHRPLSSMRARDRQVGLLVHAAGRSPADAAALLQLPLDDVLQRVGRIETRLADAARLGPIDVVASGP